MASTKQRRDYTSNEIIRVMNVLQYAINKRQDDASDETSSSLSMTRSFMISQQNYHDISMLIDAGHELQLLAKKKPVLSEVNKG